MSCRLPGGLLEQPAGVIGLSVQMAPGTEPQGLLRIIAQQPCDPQVVTLSISKEIITDAAAPTDHRVQIQVKFGTGAAGTIFRFDARNGARVTVPTNSLYVSAIYLGATGPLVNISCAAAYGSRPGAGEAAVTLTEAAETVVAGANSAVTTIPAYAARVSWVSSDSPLRIPPPQGTIQLSGEPLFGAVEQQMAPDAGQFVAIAAGMEYARVRNDTTDTSFQLVYELAL